VRQAGLILTVSVVTLAVAALGVFLWLRTYQPLSAHGSVTPGPGVGADVEPTFGSGGKRVFIPAYKAGRPFDVAFTLRNTGRFAVTLEDARTEPIGALSQDRLLLTNSTGAEPNHLRPFKDVRLDPQSSAVIVARWRLDCSESVPGGEITTDRVHLRYRYLSMFTRTASVELPFAVTLRCAGGPPDQP
jgi:hypothetical protein